MAADSIISVGTVVRGNVHGSGALAIQGRVEGNVTVDGSVTLGAHAVVVGAITAASVSVSGTVSGDITADESLLLEATARVVGDLVANRIGISPGALVRGNVRTSGEPAQEKAERTARAAAPRTKAVSAAVTPPRAVQVESFKKPAPVAVKVAAPLKKKSAQRPPPPVVPALKRGAKGKKKKARH